MPKEPIEDIRENLKKFVDQFLDQLDQRLVRVAPNPSTVEERIRALEDKVSDLERRETVVRYQWIPSSFPWGWSYPIWKTPMNTNDPYEVTSTPNAAKLT